ncbi:SRPBCC family protein [Pelomonas sp. CA6]|uniref:SRPBCC family protein n=1 Tax=Pelomonas sp. CA6 TaxID=2907999 RepID=UPI001F4C0A10|nr:SRPBCC family protein [Pelomonas sp. CA6]MCH7344556.1 SRPBCC family protein [Pelomonas sp. CA6]
MRLLKRVLLVFVLLLGLLLLGGLAMPSKFRVVREVQIGASADKVYALIASPRQWAGWSVWHQRDPAMMIDYSGPESGVGASWAWRSQSEGDGRMRFTAAEPGRRLGYELFFPDFGTSSQGEFVLEPTAGGTRVVWRMDGDMGRNPLYHWMALFADRMVGQDFEAGLNGLKRLAEKP